MRSARWRRWPPPGQGVAARKASLGGFDTHSSQPDSHARLLNELADGLGALRAALVEIGRWDGALVMTYAEYGRRPRENLSRGTDHEMARAHFVVGGGVHGGLYGLAPGLSRLDGNGNLPFAVDFRDLHATALEDWWGVDSAPALEGRFKPRGCGRPDAAAPRRRGRSRHDDVLGRRQAA